MTRVTLINIQRGDVCMFVCMKLQGLDHTHHCVFKLVIASSSSSPLQWGRSDDPGTPSPLVHTLPSSVDTSGDELAHHGWLCSTAGPLWSFSYMAELLKSHFVTGIPLKDVHVRLSTNWTKSQFKSHQVPRLQMEQDLALQLENALRALLWYSLHAV